MDENVSQAIAERLTFRPAELRRLRRKRGLRQVDAGNVLDVSPQTIRDWEAGRSRPTGRNLTNVLKLLDLLRRASA